MEPKIPEPDVHSNGEKAKLDRLDQWHTCAWCRGLGWQGTDPIRCLPNDREECEVCGGRGKVSQMRIEEFVKEHPLTVIFFKDYLSPDVQYGEPVDAYLRSTLSKRDAEEGT